MARTNLTKKQLRSPYNAGNNTALYTKLAEHDTAIDAIEAGGTTNTSQIHHVRAASTGAIANLAACSTTIDTSVTLVAGDRVLVKDQADAKYNGIYVVGTVDAGAAPLTRATDWDATAEIKQGTFVHVREGTANANLIFELTGDSPMTVGTTHQHFTGVWVSSAVLAADGGGRALMATGFFDETKATDAFAAGAIDGSTLLKDASVPCGKLAGSVRSAPQALSGAGAINITTATTLFTSTGAGQALTLVDSTVAGQRKRVVHIVDGGSGVITQTTGAKLTAGITTITFTNVYDWVELEWSGSLWNVIGYGGVTIA